jgi:hypothetical protein
VKRIDEARLESDLAYRFNYLGEFMGFAPDEIAAIHGAAPHLAPVVPAIVDAVYDKLQTYDATWRHFVPRQFGYEGEVPESVETLSMDHSQIQFRKQHLGRYVTKLVTAPYDGKMVSYLDAVGKMHTPQGGSPHLNVPLVQMNALMGFVADALTNIIFSLGLDRQSEVRTVRAFNKLLWLQNDLINRHYQAEPARKRMPTMAAV